jgi:hypothetical protein
MNEKISFLGAGPCPGSLTMNKDELLGQFPEVLNYQSAICFNLVRDDYDVHSNFDSELTLQQYKF